jgi:predicted ATPase
LSVFAGGCSLELAESICSDEATVHDAVFGLLALLVDKSLVSVQPDANGDMRYRLLETVRIYAVQRLAEESEVPAAEAAPRGVPSAVR